MPVDKEAGDGSGELSQGIGRLIGEDAKGEVVGAEGGRRHGSLEVNE